MNFTSAADTAMLVQYHADPVHPGINALLHFFNCFAIIPVLCRLYCHRVGPVLITSGPFLAMSTFIGYFGFDRIWRSGYRRMLLTIRRHELVHGQGMENKIFYRVDSAAFSLYVPFGSV
jgi:hypothetical protein